MTIAGSPLDPPTQLDLFEQDLEIPTAKMLLRLDEAARLLQVSCEQVKRLADEGEIEAIPISAKLDGRRTHYRYSTRSVEAFINRRRRMAL
jgi:hypothetical protein